MKLKLLIPLALLGTPLAFAHEGHDHEKESKEEHAGHDHDHDDHHKKGPNGGQLVESKGGFTFEVAVDEERKARIVFLDAESKPAALENQTITGIAGERAAPVKLTFAKGEGDDGNVLISDQALPPGAHVQMILVIKTDADAKPVTERFELHLH